MSELLDRPGARLLTLSVLLVAFATITGSMVVLVLGAALGWGALIAALPAGGLTPALAVGVLWSNAAIVTSQEFGAPAALGLLPQVLFAGAVIGRVVVRQRGLVATPAFRALLLHGAALSLASLTALNAGPVQSATETFLVEGPVLWLLVLNAIGDRRSLERAAMALVFVAGLMGALSTFQFVTKTYDNDYFGFAKVDQERAEALQAGEDITPRLNGPIGEQNRYAQSLLVTVPIAITLARRRSARLSVPLLASASFAIAGVALTASRGAAVGLLAALVGMVAFRVISPRALAVVAVAAAAAMMVLPGYRERIASSLNATQGVEQSEEVDGSTLSRITENLAALEAFADHPIFGVGPGGFPREYEKYAERIGLNVKDEARQPHNLYLGTAAETGLLGLLTFLLIPAVLLRRLHRVWQAARDRGLFQLSDLAAGFFVSIGAYLVSGVFLHLAFERYLWLLFALGDVAARIVGRAAAAPPAIDERPPLEVASTGLMRPSRLTLAD